MENKGNYVVSGNESVVWVNNEIWDDIKSIEFKMTGEFEDVTFMGDPRTHKKYLGFTGEGTITTNKMYSRGATLLGDAFKTGIMPDVKIVTKITNKSTGKSERIAISGITFSEFGGSTEAKTIASEELPFSFSDYDVLETL